MKEQHFGKSFSTDVSENYERFFVPVIGEPLAKDLVKSAHLNKNDKVLDVACGTGVVARLAAEKIEAEGRVEGLDVNHGMLEVARSATPKEKSIKWHEASAASMPLPDDTYDVVMCQMGLQFVEDKEAVLKEIYRVLAPGGRIVLNVPGPISPLFKMMDKGLEKHINPKAAGFVDVVFSLYDPEEIVKLLKNAGFDDVNVRQETKTLHLPKPKEFLWQYISSTPLSALFSKADDKSCAALENEMTDKWQQFVDNGEMKYDQNITIAIAKKKK